MGWINDATAGLWRAGHRAGSMFAAEGEQTKLPGPDHDYWYGAVGGGNQAGMPVTPYTAMTATAVYSCVKVIAETLSQLPCITYRRLPGGGRQRADQHPISSLLHDQPNELHTAYEFWELAAGFAVLRGKSYAEIMPGPRGPVDQLWVLNPDQLTPRWANDGRRVRFLYTPGGGEPQRVLLQNEVFRFNTLGGISPIAQHREAIGLALAAQGHGSRFFSNSANPTGVLTSEKPLGDEGQKNVLKGWNKAHQGVPNSNKVAVLEDGVTWTRIGMTSEDAQFLETRQFQVAEIARIFRVPPHMIADLENATFSNIEHQAISFVVHTMTPWLVRIEQAIRRDLIVAKDVFFSEFLVEGLLRGDSKSRAELYQSGIQQGWLTRNEVRDLENRNPLPGLDEPLVPLNMVPAGSTRDNLARNSKGLAMASELALADARRFVHREATACERAFAKHSAADDAEGFRAWTEDFYQRQAAQLADSLALPEAVAAAVCSERRAVLLIAAETPGADGAPAIPETLRRWRRTAPPQLAALCMQELCGTTDSETQGAIDAA